MRPPETYDKEMQCDLLDPKQQRLGRISEDQEFDDWQDDFDNRFEMASRNITQERRRGSAQGSMHQKAKAKEAKLLEQKEEEVKVVELTKVEQEQIIKSPDF